MQSRLCYSGIIEIGYSGDQFSNMEFSRILTGIAKYLTDQKKLENKKIEERKAKKGPKNRELIQFGRCNSTSSSLSKLFQPSIVKARCRAYILITARMLVQIMI
jgi:hypothetical protein